MMINEDYFSVLEGGSSFELPKIFGDDDIGADDEVQQQPQQQQLPVAFVSPSPHLPTNTTLLRMSGKVGWQYNAISERHEIHRGKKVKLELNSKGNAGDHLVLMMRHSESIYENDYLRNCKAAKHNNSDFPEAVFSIILPKCNATTTQYIDGNNNCCYRIDNMEGLDWIIIIMQCLSSEDCNKGGEELARKWKLVATGVVDHHLVDQSIMLQSMTMLRSTDRLKGRNGRKRGNSGETPPPFKREKQDNDDEVDVAVKHRELMMKLAEMESSLLSRDLQELELPILEHKIRLLQATCKHLQKHL